MKIIEGKKVMLFPFKEDDFDYFFKLYQGGDKFSNAEMERVAGEDDIKNYLALSMANGMMLTWAVYTKEGKGAKPIGIVYLTALAGHRCSMQGLVDPSIMNGLEKHLRSKHKLTYAEDALRTIVNFCFTDMDKERVDTMMSSTEETGLALMKKAGFEQEGVLRRYGKDPAGNFFDMVIMSVVRKDPGKDAENGDNKKS